uniref:Uncharacterized protein n=1 Tax=Arundo donax TaxID=35708 RepID=A0A0A9BEJ8_ARUDO
MRARRIPNPLHHLTEILSL